MEKNKAAYGDSYIIIYTEALETWRNLTDEEVGQLVRAMMEYKRTGTVPELSGGAHFVFPLMQSQIDRETAAYQAKVDRLRANGARGGRPKKDQ